MPDNSFDSLRQSPASTRRVVLSGIVVLVLASIGAIAAGVVAQNREPAPVIVNQAPTTTLTAPAAAADLIGTYSGELRNAADAADAANAPVFTAALALTGATGLLTYPDKGCQVFLSEAKPGANGEVTYKAASLAKCDAAGEWTFTRTDVGLTAAYTEDGATGVTPVVVGEFMRVESSSK